MAEVVYYPLACSEEDMEAKFLNYLKKEALTMGNSFNHLVFEDSFETADLEGNPFGWSTETNHGKPELDWDKKIKHFGLRSLKIANSSQSEAKGSWSLKWENMTKEYTVSVYIKTEGVKGEGAGICVDYEGCQMKELISSFVKGTKDWQKVSLKVHVPAHVRYFSIKLFLSCSNGKTCFDDIKMTSSQLLFPLVKKLPSGWHRGYIHYHTSFGRPSPYQLSPQMLISQMEQTGASFVFCTADHSYEFGPGVVYSGWDYDKEYHNLCWKSSSPKVILVPASEHLRRFPGKPHPETGEPVQHHYMAAYWEWNLLDRQPNERVRFLASGFQDIYREKRKSLPRLAATPEFIKKARQNNVMLAICHPALGVHGWWGLVPPAPVPTNVSEFYDLDYYEFFNNGDLKDAFEEDFNYYLQFLSDSRSFKMGCYSATEGKGERILSPCESPQLKRCTYIYIFGKFSSKSLRKAWNNRQTYAVDGFLYFKNLSPVPSKEDIKGIRIPRIEFTVEDSMKEAISKVEIYNKGRKVYEDRGSDKPIYTLSWKDKTISEKRANYVIHIEAGSDRLVTSPINYSFL